MPPRKRSPTTMPCKRLKLAATPTDDLPDRTNAGPSSSTSISNGPRTIARPTRGSLQAFPEFAIEIQLEVFGLVDPRDLLSLARTCKKFRAFFLHPSNERLWAAARSNVGDLPPRPPFLSEPAFINLLFFPTCHNCGRGNTQKVIWEWHVRYCSECIIAMSYAPSEASRNLDLSLTDVRRLFHTYEVPSRLCSDQGLWSYQSARVHKLEVHGVEALLREAANPLPTVCRDAIMATQLTRYAEFQQSIKQCMEWHSRQKARQSADLNVRKEQRFIEIVKHLRESGWDKEIDFLGERGLRHMSTFPYVRATSKLTQKEWKKIMDIVDDYLRMTRTRRIDRQREDELRPRFALLKEALLSHYVHTPRTAAVDSRPEYVDLALMDECKAIVDVPSSVHVTCEDFTAIIPGLVAQWEEKQRAALRNAVLQCIDFPVQGRDPLELAVAVFPCARCAHGRLFPFYRYPAVLGHPCAHIHDDYPPDPDIDYPPPQDRSVDVYKRAAIIADPDLDNFGRRFPFEPKTMCGAGRYILKRTIQNMCSILRALGLDPTCATFEDLLNCEGRVCCYVCNFHFAGHTPETNGRMKVFTWEAALVHSFLYQMTKVHNDWRPVRAEGVLATRAVEAQAHALSLSAPGSVWVCSLCTDWDELGERSERIQAHLIEEHGITYSDECINDGTIYLHPGKSVALLRPAVLLPVDGH